MIAVEPIRMALPKTCMVIEFSFPFNSAVPRSFSRNGNLRHGLRQKCETVSACVLVNVADFPVCENNLHLFVVEDFFHSQFGRLRRLSK